MSIAKQQMSIKTKNKMSISHTGKLKSKETIAKMSKPKTQEHKAKISEAVYKRWNKVV